MPGGTISCILLAATVLAFAFATRFSNSPLPTAGGSPFTEINSKWACLSIVGVIVLALAFFGSVFWGLIH